MLRKEEWARKVPAGRYLAHQWVFSGASRQAGRGEGAHSMEEHVCVGCNPASSGPCEVRENPLCVGRGKKRAVL